MSATPAPAVRGPRTRLSRSVAVWIVLAVAGLLLLLTSFAVWVDRVALNTERFVDTSTELIEDDAIRKAVASRAVDELFESVDVEAELEERLPKDFKNLSGPARAALREAAYTLVARALGQPRLERVWALTVEQTHRTLVLVLEGDPETVSTEGGVVTLDLERIVLEAADRIGIRKQVEDNLPEDVGQIEILRSDELDAAQDAFQLLKALAWVLPILTLGAFALAVWLAGDRRRVARRIGVTVVLVGLLGLVAVNLFGNYLVDALVAETDTRTAAGNAWDILTASLRHSFRWQVAIGIVFLVAAWLAGPGPRATAVRRYLAPAVRDRAWAYAGLAVLALVLLVNAGVGDVTAFLVVATAVALGAVWIEVTRKQTAHEFPDASASALLDEARTRFASWWKEYRAAATRPRPARAASESSLAAALVSLADLHARGELTDEEFAAAKARVLAGD
jgi:hypothetical protein